MTFDKSNFNCMIAGVGGQGTVLASKLIAAAAMKKGYNVRTTETIGMAQRGGSVVSHICIGRDIFSPLIPAGKAQALIAFEPAEAVRNLRFLCAEGHLIVCDSAVQPAGADTGAYRAETMLEYLKANAVKLAVINGQHIVQKNVKTLNVTILGAAAQSGVFPFDAETLKEVIPEMIHERFVEMNISAFELGRSIFHDN